jgi:uncharacterized membrane protein HdeD (DUF308 family)
MSAITPSIRDWLVARSDWWRAVIWGVAGVIVGLFLLTRPIASALVLVTTLGLFLLLGGVVDTLHAVLTRVEGWFWHIAGGVLLVLVGLFVLAQLLTGTVVAITLLFLIVALAVLANGLIGLMQPGNRSVSRILLSALQVVLGAVLLVAFFNMLTLGMVVQIIGIVAVAGGISSILAAFGSNTHVQATA